MPDRDAKSTMTAIPVFVVPKPEIPLPLKEDDGYHVHVIVPFSLIVRDLDPNATRAPVTLEHRRFTWWATRLFGRWKEISSEPQLEAIGIANPHLTNIWPRLSAILFGREEPARYSMTACDVEDWKHVNGSHVFWTAFVGAIDNTNTRVVVLRADGSLVHGGIQFTLEEMGDKDKQAWKEEYLGYCMSNVSRTQGLPAADIELIRRNLALNGRMMLDWANHKGSHEKDRDSFESSVLSSDGKARDRRPSAGLWCFKH